MIDFIWPFLFSTVW